MNARLMDVLLQVTPGLERLLTVRKGTHEWPFARLSKTDMGAEMCPEVA